MATHVKSTVCLQEHGLRWVPIIFSSGPMWGGWDPFLPSDLKSSHQPDVAQHISALQGQIDSAKRLGLDIAFFNGHTGAIPLPPSGALAFHRSGMFGWENPRVVLLRHRGDSQIFLILPLRVSLSLSHTHTRCQSLCSGNSRRLHSHICHCLSSCGVFHGIKSKGTSSHLMFSCHVREWLSLLCQRASLSIHSHADVKLISEVNYWGLLKYLF